MRLDQAQPCWNWEAAKIIYKSVITVNKKYLNKEK